MSPVPTLFLLVCCFFSVITLDCRVLQLYSSISWDVSIKERALYVQVFMAAAVLPMLTFSYFEKH